MVDMILVVTCTYYALPHMQLLLLRVKQLANFFFSISYHLPPLASSFMEIHLHNPCFLLSKPPPILSSALLLYPTVFPIIILYNNNSSASYTSSLGTLFAVRYAAI